MTTKYYKDASGNYLGGYSDGSPSIPAGAIEVNDAPDRADLIHDGTSWKPSKDILKANLANYRWLQEIGGITWNGTFIRTDDRSKLLLAAIQTQIKNNNNQNNARLVKTANGFVTMTDAQLEALYTDVVGHVQKCFDAEEATIAKIDDNTLTTDAAVESEFDTQFAAL